jgi:hypothetical protein
MLLKARAGFGQLKAWLTTCDPCEIHAPATKSRAIRLKPTEYSRTDFYLETADHGCGTTPAALVRPSIWMTGCRVGQIESVQNREPVYLRYLPGVSERFVYWEQVALPIVAKGRLVKPMFLLGYPAPIDDRTDILKTIFEYSPTALGTAAPDQFFNPRPKRDGTVL